MGPRLTCMLNESGSLSCLNPSPAAGDAGLTWDQSHATALRLLPRGIGFEGKALPS